MEQLVTKARNGDEKALSALISKIEAPVYQMAVRMLGHPSDAEDATQEILIKVMTNLASFRQKSSFKTWVYKISVNHLLNIKRTWADRLNISFQSWEEYIYADKGDININSFSDAEKDLIINEVRSGCLQGMLLCLKKDIRIAFLLGEVFELSSREGARILEITPETFRKRLSRGREKIKAFMIKNCGLVKESNPCICQEQAERDINMGLIDPIKLDFAGKNNQRKNLLDISKALKECDEMEKIIALFRTYPRFSSPKSFTEIIQHLIHSQQFSLLQ